MNTENLTALMQYEKIKKNALYKNDSFEVLMIAIAKDELLKPHTSKTDAFLTVLEGVLTFTLEGNDTKLHKGDFISFKAGELHSITAVTNASVLLIK